MKQGFNKFKLCYKHPIKKQKDLYLIVVIHEDNSMSMLTTYEGIFLGGLVIMKEDSSLDWNYDNEFDILFIHRIEKYEYEESIEMTCDVLMDFDTLLNPSAFEFLNASKIFKSNNGDLCDIEKINVHVSINEDLIKLYVDIFTPNNKFDTVKKFINDIDAPSCEWDMVAI